MTLITPNSDELFAAEFLQLQPKRIFRTGSKIIQKLIEHDGRLERIEANMVTKDAFNDRMDKMMTILQRLDQERLFTVEWIKRIENDVEKIKDHLHIA